MVMHAWWSRRRAVLLVLSSIALLATGALLAERDPGPARGSRRVTLDYGSARIVNGTLGGEACRIVGALGSGRGAAVVVSCNATLQTVLLDRLPTARADALASAADATAAVLPGVMSGAATHGGSVMLLRDVDGRLRVAGTLAAFERLAPLPLDLAFQETEFRRGSSRIVARGHDLLPAGWIGGDTLAQVEHALAHGGPFERLVFVDPQPGVVDVTAGVLLGRLVREAELVTVVGVGVTVRGGSADVFIAGTSRTIRDRGELLVGADLVDCAWTELTWHAFGAVLRVYAIEMLGPRAGTDHAMCAIACRRGGHAQRLTRMDLARYAIAHTAVRAVPGDTGDVTP